jgi:hypothetical protein
MLKVKGIYDGDKVILLDPVKMRPNTTVEVLIPESAADPEQRYWQRLVDAGLIKSVRAARVQPRRAPAPVRVAGTPVSQTLMDERR